MEQENTMMKLIHAYLTFDGNCREAMQFYQRCLGGVLRLQTVGASPLSEKLPSVMKKCILHAELKNDNLLIYGSDMVEGHGLIKGNAVSLALNCTSEQEIRACYKSLSNGGRQTHPLSTTFENALFGGLQDRFGHNWILNFSKK